MSTRTIRVALMCVVPLAAGVIIGSFVISSAGAANPWGCDLTRLADSHIQNATAGGYKTRPEAVAAWIPQLARESVVAQDALLAAFDSRTGPDRYEPESGRLFVADQLQAEFGVEELSDGSLAVASVAYCSEPPSKLGQPGETPSSSSGGSP